MSVPKDQGLTLTVFLSISLFAVLLFWVFLPVHYGHQSEEEEVIKFLEPEEAILTAEQILKQAEASIAELEKEDEEGEGAGAGGGEKEEADKK